MAHVSPARRDRATFRALLPLIGALCALPGACAAETGDAAGAVVPLDAAAVERCRGKTASEWAEAIRGWNDWKQLKPALEALLELGAAPPSLTPDLVRIIRENADADVTRLALLTLGISATDAPD